MNTNYGKPLNWIPKFFPSPITLFLSWMARALVQILIGTQLQQIPALCHTGSDFVCTCSIFEYVCRLLDKKWDICQCSESPEKHFVFGIFNIQTFFNCLQPTIQRSKKTVLTQRYYSDKISRSAVLDAAGLKVMLNVSN